MVIRLLERTRYVGGDEYFDTVSSLKDHVEGCWLLKPGDTVFVAAGSKSYTDSSQEVLNQIKSCAWSDPGWTRSKFLVSYNAAATAVPRDGTIVIVDDFIGSGGSIFKTLAWFMAERHVLCKPFNMKVISVAACSGGLNALRAAGHQVHSEIIVQKGLSDNLSGAALTQAISLMNDLEDKLANLLRKRKSLDDYRFGWGRQEAVYLRKGGNTPNNVFPILWWDRTKVGKRPTIMHRTR